MRGIATLRVVTFADLRSVLHTVLGEEPTTRQEEPVSRSLNKVMLIGNVGNDPEVRATNNGARVANTQPRYNANLERGGRRPSGKDRVAPLRAVERSRVGRAPRYGT
jgi:hypothetical protein